MTVAIAVKKEVNHKERDRHAYLAIRGRSHCDDRAIFDLLVKQALANTGKKNPTSADAVICAKSVKIPCARCAGSGSFITGMLNGKPVGPGGECYRCNGKGWQNDQDARRNYGADIHAVVRF